MKLSNQELNDLLSAITEWQRTLNKKENPQTALALEALKKRLWAEIKKAKP